LAHFVAVAASSRSARRFPSTRVVKAFNATFGEIYQARRMKIAG
jgi:hypothetical protein